MKALRSVLCPLLAAFVLGGCLESKQTVRLETDGRGRIEQTFVVDRTARDLLLRRMAALHGAQGESGELPFADPFAPRWLRARAEGFDDYVIERVERPDEDDARITTYVKATFGSLEAAARAGAFFPAAVTLEPAGREAWRLVFRDPWEPAARDTHGELAGRPYAEVLDAFREALGGFGIERTIVLPTKVLETNGHLDEDGRTVTWRVDLERLEARKDLALVITFATTPELKLQRFRYHPDPEALMTRALEPPP